MWSGRAPQGVLKRFYRYFEKLLEKRFALVPSAEIKDAMLSALPGEWKMDGYTVKLEKLHSRGATYELRLVLEG